MNMRGARELLLLLLAATVDVDGFYISLNMSTKTVNDDTFVVACRDDIGGLAVTWRNPKGVVLGPKTRPHVAESSYGCSIIFNSPLKLEDTGNYTCSTEKEKRTFELIVEPPLKFTDTKTNQSAVEGSDFVLKCEVTGGTVSWAEDGGGAIEQNKRFKVIGDGLFISKVNRHDSKTYICKGVQQRTGTVLDRKIHLVVKHRPIHPNHPTKHMRQDVVYGYINGTVNLTCLAIATPPAHFTWKMSDKKAKIGHIINEPPDVSILQLHISNDAAFGNYKCVANNSLGIYEENFILKAGMKPVRPSSVEMNAAASESAMFEIIGPEMTPELDMDTKGFRVLYKKIDEEDWTRKEFNITKNNIYIIENLEPNTEYELQAATRNAAGLSEYFPAIQWKTSGAAGIGLTWSLLCVILHVAFW